MQVETKNASLDTMVVTIKTLHVSGKQMTLAVFRQLPTAVAFKESGELMDLDFWGTVRYPIKDESSFWAVASSGGILYRCDADPGRRSITSLVNHVTAARANLNNYQEWELAEIKFRAWLSLPSENRTPPPERLDSYRCNYKIGEESYYADLALASVENLSRGKTIEKAIAKLAALPQLFIAV